MAKSACGKLFLGDEV